MIELVLALVLAEAQSSTVKETELESICGAQVSSTAVYFVSAFGGLLPVPKRYVLVPEERGFVYLRSEPIDSGSENDRIVGSLKFFKASQFGLSPWAERVEKSRVEALFRGCSIQTKHYHGVYETPLSNIALEADFIAYGDMVLMHHDENSRLFEAMIESFLRLNCGSRNFAWSVCD